MRLRPAFTQASTARRGPLTGRIGSRNSTHLGSAVEIGCAAGAAERGCHGLPVGPEATLQGQGQQAQQRPVRERGAMDSAAAAESKHAQRSASALETQQRPVLSKNNKYYIAGRQAAHKALGCVTDRQAVLRWRMKAGWG